MIFINLHFYPECSTCALLACVKGNLVFCSQSRFFFKHFEKFFDLSLSKPYFPSPTKLCFIYIFFFLITLLRVVGSEDSAILLIPSRRGSNRHNSVGSAFLQGLRDFKSSLFSDLASISPSHLISQLSDLSALFFIFVLQVRERGIRSQFACTYTDDGLPLNRVLDFPRTSQLPTCIHPAPKWTVSSAVNTPPEDESDPADKCEKQGTLSSVLFV